MIARHPRLFRTLAHGIVSVASLVACLSCSSSPNTQDLKLLNAPPKVSDSAEIERLRQMELVQAYDTTQGSTPVLVDVPDGPTQGKPGLFLSNLVSESCLEQAGVAQPGQTSCAQDNADCDKDICIDLDYLCWAKTYLSIVNQVSSPPKIGGFIFPPQSAATNAGIARQARNYAWTAFYNANATVNALANQPTPLQHCTGSDAALDFAHGGADAMSRLSTATSLFAEAYQTFHEATDAQEQALLAAADEQVASSPSLDVSAARSVAGADLSRAEAAHVLVGGSAGLQGVTTSPFCTVPELGPDQQAALSILRESGVSPVALQSGLDTDTLLNDTGSQVPGGSVKQRIIAAYPQLSPGQSLSDYFSLTDDAFSGARQYMSQEITAFSRSLTALLPAAPLPGGGAAQYQRFAATANPPGVVSPVYFAALAAAGQQSDNVDGTPPVISATDFEDQSVSSAASLLSEIQNLPPEQASKSVKSKALAPLALLLSAKALTGRITIIPVAPVMQQDPNPPVEVTYFAVSGYAPADRLLAVFGEDALRCAVDGTIEGGTDALDGQGRPSVAPCQLNSQNSLPLTSDWSPDPDFQTGAYSTINGALPAGRVYLLQSRALLGSPDAPLPGQFKALMGFTLQDPTQYVSVPVVPAMQQQAGKSLAPSRAWCSTSQTSCAGFDFDDRLPLEDELTSTTQDPSEASWRHYLDLAKDAATTADNLATDYINSGLNSAQNAVSVEQRQEDQQSRAADEIANLEKICGTSIDPNKLLTLLSGGDSDASNATSGACASDGTCAAGKQCISGECVMDLSALVKDNPDDPDLQRLADCLDTGGLKPYVSLGAHPVCLWEDADNANLICKGAQPGTCPVLASGQDCGGALGLPTDSHAVVNKQSIPLNFIQGDVGGQGKMGVCSALTALRNNPALRSPTSSYWLGLISDNTFHPEALQQTMSRIGYEALYGGFAAITVDGVARYETGAFDKGVSSGWPCADPQICEFTKSGLFCNPNTTPQSWPTDCNNLASRGKANYLMLRAYLAAGMITSSGRDSVLDTFNYGHNDSYNIDIDLQALLIANGTTPTSPAQQGYQSLSFSALQLPDHYFGGVDGERHIYGDPSRPLKAQTTTFFYGNNAPRDDYDDGTGLTLYTTNLNPSDNPARILWIDSTGTAQYGDYVSRANAIPAYDMYFLPTGVSPKDYFLAGLSDYRINSVNSGYFQNFFTGASAGDIQPLVLLFAGPDASSDAPFSLLGSINDNSQSLTAEDVLNGLDLLCSVAHKDDAVSLSTPPVVRTIDDLAGAANYIKLLSQTINRQASLTVFPNLPQTAINALEQGSVNGAYPQFSGDMGTALAQLRGGLEGVQETIPTIANEVQQFGDQLQQLHDALHNLDLDTDISKLKLASTISENAAQCAGSIGVGSIISLGTLASCANAVAQIDFATSIQQLQTQVNDTTKDSELAAFDSEFATHATNLQKASLDFSKASEDVNAGLSTLDGLRDSARVSISRALYLLSSQAQSQAEVTAVLSNLYNGKQLRYKAALQNAKRLAFVAKRAIEQRIGVRLASITDNLPLVDAPSSWESSICSMTGVDYSALTSTAATATGQTSGVQSFAAGFVGDYVTKLENVVESYPLVHNFHEGTDTAVVSLRDDLLNVRANCSVASGNLLYYTTNLQPRVPAQSAPVVPTWTRENCLTVTDGNGVTSDAPDCIAVTDNGAPAVADPAFSQAHAFSVNFGVGATATARLAQDLTLAGGTYRFSWYTTDSVGASSGFVEGHTGALQALPADSDSASATPPWSRRFIVFTVPSSEVVSIGFKRVSATTTALSAGAPMLELLPPGGTETFAMKPFAPTTDSLNQLLPVCEDTSGEIFRATEWRRDCEMLCPDGSGSTCSADHAVQSCFREAHFGISQRDIQAGKFFNLGGFAKGNFNYRIDSMAVNFVGTGIHDCSNSLLPSTCNSAAFVTYTLQHNGPFFVRNYAGDDFQAYLFNGTVEHARGLASERYLTNPMSDTDKGLVANYVRTEFQGRPLDGNFVLRVWEDPTVNFEAIQDVQFVFNYRYWTAFN